jgi:hypothetical protein
MTIKEKEEGAATKWAGNIPSQSFFDNKPKLKKRSK